MRDKHTWGIAQSEKRLKALHASATTFEYACVLQRARVVPARFSLLFHHPLCIDAARLGFPAVPLAGSDTYVAPRPTRAARANGRYATNLVRVAEIGSLRRLILEGNKLNNCLENRYDSQVKYVMRARQRSSSFWSFTLTYDDVPEGDAEPAEGRRRAKHEPKKGAIDRERRDTAISQWVQRQQMVRGAQTARPTIREYYEGDDESKWPQRAVYPPASAR